MVTNILDKIRNWNSQYILLAIVITLSFAILIYDGDKLFRWAWSHEFLNALMGAAVVTLITFSLIKGQANTDSRVDQKRKVFDNQIKAYEIFLETLREVVIKNEISFEDEKRLQYGVAIIGMHVTSDKMLRLSKDLKKIGLKLRVDNKVDGQIWPEIIDIVQVFQSTLYEREDYEIDSNLIKAIRNFGDIRLDEENAPIKYVLEYVECMLSQFNFDTHIGENCLYINIHFREQAYKQLKSLSQLKSKTPYRLYVTVNVEKNIGNKYEGCIAVYSGNSRKKQEKLINTIYENFWREPDDLEREKGDFVFKEGPFNIGCMEVSYAYFLEFKNRDKYELQAIVIDILSYLSDLWDEPDRRYRCLRWEKNENAWKEKIVCFTPNDRE